MSKLTLDSVKKVMPPSLRSSITQDTINLLNNLSVDPTVADSIRNNYIGYTDVLNKGIFKTEDYLHAVMYVSYKLMGYSNLDSYIKVFPNRYARFKANQMPAKDINSIISAYNRGKLVNLILEQTLVPSWVLNQDIYQEAINTQAELMRTARSEMVRCKAADCLLSHLTKPEQAGPLINIDMSQNKEVTDLKESLYELAKTQKQLIESGVSTKSIAEQNIIDVEGTIDENS